MNLKHVQFYCLNDECFSQASGSTPMVAHISWNWTLNCEFFRISCLCLLANSSRLDLNVSNCLDIWQIKQKQFTKETKILYDSFLPYFHVQAVNKQVRYLSYSISIKEEYLRMNFTSLLYWRQKGNSVTRAHLDNLVLCHNGSSFLVSGLQKDKTQMRQVLL